MEGVKFGNENVTISIYGIEDNIIIQIDKKKTRDKLSLTKRDWSLLSTKIFEHCYKNEAKEVIEALNKEGEKRKTALQDGQSNKQNEGTEG